MNDCDNEIIISKMGYDNSSFFVLNEIVDIWVVLSDDGRVIVNLQITISVYYHWFEIYLIYNQGVSLDRIWE